MVEIRNVYKIVAAKPGGKRLFITYKRKAMFVHQSAYFNLEIIEQISVSFSI
jgi:hypothetical protein